MIYNYTSFYLCHKIFLYNFQMLKTLTLLLAGLVPGMCSKTDLVLLGLSGLRLAGRGEILNNGDLFSLKPVPGLFSLELVEGLSSSFRMSNPTVSSWTGLTEVIGSSMEGFLLP
jgi:hypothetical protein